MLLATFPEVVSVLVCKIIDHIELKLIPLIPHECESFEKRLCHVPCLQ